LYNHYLLVVICQYIDFQPPASHGYNPQTSKKARSKVKDRAETNGRTDTTDYSTFPANAVDSKSVLILVPRITAYDAASSLLRSGASRKYTSTSVAGVWAVANQLHVAAAYWLSIDGTDRRTDRRTPLAARSGQHIGADSTGATGNFAPVLTQEPGQTMRFAPVPFMAVL